jgi:hypothetical protein
MASSAGQRCLPAAPLASSQFPQRPRLANLASNTEEGRVQLELEATEGKGISAAQAKIHHSPILNTPALQDFLSNKVHVNVLAFGQNSPLTTFLRTWSHHIVSHRESYELLTNADPSFCSSIGHIIDMAEQAFLCSCITSSTMLDIDQSVLDHASLRTGISLGMMPAVAIPASLASILPSSAPRSRPPAIPHDESPSKRSKANKEIAKDKPKARDSPRENPQPTTRTVPPVWKTIVDNGNHSFALSSSLGPLGDALNCSEPGLCGKLLLRGRCTVTGCPREASHSLIHALDPTQLIAVEKWFNAACKEQKILWHAGPALSDQLRPDRALRPLSNLSNQPDRRYLAPREAPDDLFNVGCSPNAPHLSLDQPWPGANPWITPPQCCHRPSQQPSRPDCGKHWPATW